MKTFLLACLAISAASAVQGKSVTPQTKASGFTYPAGSTAAYPPGTGLIYNSGTQVKYPAGTSIIFPYAVTVMFPYDSQFYVQKGPVDVLAGSNFTFGSNTQVSFPPGTWVQYVTNNAEAKYQQFNGNTHTIAQYEKQTPAQYYCTNCNLILFQSTTNPLVYYNPGGSTQFGTSALPVEKDYTPAPMTRTYGYYGGGGGYSYCSGYSYNGYPTTTYQNYNTGYSTSCYQTCYNCYSYSGGGGGGYTTGGGSCYGSGAYYGGGGGYYG